MKERILIPEKSETRERQKKEIERQKKIKSYFDRNVFDLWSSLEKTTVEDVRDKLIEKIGTSPDFVFMHGGMTRIHSLPAKGVIVLDNGEKRELPSKGIMIPNLGTGCRSYKNGNGMEAGSQLRLLGVSELAKYFPKTKVVFAASFDGYEDVKRDDVKELYKKKVLKAHRDTYSETLQVLGVPENKIDKISDDKFHCTDTFTEVIKFFDYLAKSLDKSVEVDNSKKIALFLTSFFHLERARTMVNVMLGYKDNEENPAKRNLQNYGERFFGNKNKFFENGLNVVENIKKLQEGINNNSLEIKFISAEEVFASVLGDNPEDLNSYSKNIWKNCAGSEYWNEGVYDEVYKKDLQGARIFQEGGYNKPKDNC